MCVCVRGGCVHSGTVVKVSLDPKYMTTAIIQCSDAELGLWRRGSTGIYRHHALEGLEGLGKVVVIDHCWLADGRIVLATQDRRLLFMQVGGG